MRKGIFITFKILTEESYRERLLFILKKFIVDKEVLSSASVIRSFARLQVYFRLKVVLERLTHVNELD